MLATIRSEAMDLAVRFIFEFADCCWKPAVSAHVRIASQAQSEPEWDGLGECALLKDARPDELSRDLRHHGIVPRFENIDPRDLRLLVELLGFEFIRLGEEEFLDTFLSRFEEELFEQFWMIEPARLALQKGRRGKGALLHVKLFRLPEVE